MSSGLIKQKTEDGSEYYDISSLQQNNEESMRDFSDFDLSLLDNDEKLSETIREYDRIEQNRAIINSDEWRSHNLTRRAYYSLFKGFLLGSMFGGIASYGLTKIKIIKIPQSYYLFTVGS